MRDASGYTQISMRDIVDTALTIAIHSPNSNQTLPVVTIDRGARVLCTVPATATSTLYAVCGKTRLVITFYLSSAATTERGPITGLMTTSGPLN